jgi:hypothetical protein
MRVPLRVEAFLPNRAHVVVADPELRRAIVDRIREDGPFDGVLVIDETLVDDAAAAAKLEELEAQLVEARALELTKTTRIEELEAAINEARGLDLSRIERIAELERQAGEREAAHLAELEKLTAPAVQTPAAGEGGSA